MRATIDPERIKLRPISERAIWDWNPNYLHGEPTLVHPEQHYVFRYPFPFRRPHSISIGARGLTSVSIRRDDETGEFYFAVRGDVEKSTDFRSERNHYFTEAVPLERLNLSDSTNVVTATQTTHLEAVRAGVALGLEEYAGREHDIFELIRHFRPTQPTDS